LGMGLAVGPAKTGLLFDIHPEKEAMEKNQVGGGGFAGGASPPGREVAVPAEKERRKKKKHQ